MKRSLKKGLPGGPNEKVFSKEGYRSTSPDVNNLFNFIPSGNITMKEKDGTPLKKGPLLGIDNLGNSQLMLPGANYQFPGDVVKEIPLAKKGGPFQNSNIYATNKLFVKNPLFKKRKKAKKAKGIYNPKAKYTYQPGGEIEYNQLPERYKYALQNFIYPNVSTEPNDYEENENGELVPVIRPGYNPTNNTITYDPNNPVENINNDWWREHELFHQLQTLAGGENTSDAGMLLQKPNSYVASNDSMGTYYNRRDSDVEKTIDNMIAQNPNLQFIPREKLAQSTYEEGMERPGFIGAEDLQYADPSTLEGEARQYEQYIEEGNPSIFSKKQFGGITKLSPEEEIEFQKFYATLPENLQTDDDTYDIRGYWDSEGRPESFNYDQPKENDGYYHAYSINANTGEYLKSPAHSTFQHAVDEDRKIGWRPITNVHGRNIAVENPSIREPEEQTFLRNTEGPSSYIETELTDDEINEYVKGGYVVEDISIPSLTRMDDGGENACPPDYYWNGQACVTRTHTEIDPRYIAEHPDEATRIQNEGEVVVSREASDIGKLRGEYREKNPIGIFLDEKKRQFLKKNKGLNKAAGNTMEKFPEDVLQNFIKEYEYLTNNYAVKKLGKKEGWNPKRRGEWVDELTPGEKDAVAESKYGSKLQPSYWSRSLAGVQELGNTLLPGQPLQFNIPGLTKKEQKEIRESKLGALETLAPMDIPGAAITNFVKNTGLSTGSDYKDLPGVLSGEKMSNVSDMEAMALNPLTYAGLEAIPELGVNLVKGIGRGISAAPEAISNLKKFITTEAPLNLDVPVNKIDNVVDVRSKVLKSVPEDAPYILRDELLPDYKTFKTKGRSITYDEGIDLLEDMAKKYPVLQESPRVPVYYHGTTSASLPGIIKNEGLLPVGELIREGKVPLTGELGSGVAGINNSSISTAMARGHQGALDYAIGLSGKNKVNVEDDLAKWFERGGRESFVESPYSPDISFYDDLKNKRLTEWQNLSDAEKALVQDNFPVMFGINPTKGNAQRFVIPKTDVSDELGISGKIGFEEIPSIFVPKSKVAALQEQLGAKTKVLPIEDFMQDYKNADKYNQMGYAKGGIISNLTKKEIDKLIKQGYIIEEID